jgi:hypothetical protein
MIHLDIGGFPKDHDHLVLFGEGAEQVGQNVE